MNWLEIGRGFVRMKRASLAQLTESPRLDLRHYQEQERIYSEWLASLKGAGVVAPNLMIAGVMWLGGVACARLPRPWLRAFVVATVAYMVWHFLQYEDASNP